MGFSGDSAAATAAELNTPTGFAKDNIGNIYITGGQKKVFISNTNK